MLSSYLAVIAALGLGCLYSCGASPAVDFISDAAELQSWLESTFTAFHQNAELSFQEKDTSSLIQQKLDRLGITYQTPIAHTGVRATLGSGGPTVFLRADIDALPITEHASHAPRSSNEGVMHACGHDAHITMLLGAAALLKKQEANLRGTVELLFQPAEEASGPNGVLGADKIVQEGILDDASAVFGMHVDPYLPSGLFATAPGAVMASEINFEITLFGRGGHAGVPHMNVDCIPCAASLVSATQTLVSRETAPTQAAVIAVTHLSAGGGPLLSITPSQAIVAGTMRTLDLTVQKDLRSRLEDIVIAQAASCRCTAQVDWKLHSNPPYPVLVNDHRLASLVSKTAATVLGQQNVRVMQPLMAAEDFAFYAEKAPVCFSMLGIRNESCGSVHALHSPQFKMDLSVLHLGAALHATIAWQYLAINNGHLSDHAEL